MEIIVLELSVEGIPVDDRHQRKQHERGPKSAPQFSFATSQSTQTFVNLPIAGIAMRPDAKKRLICDDRFLYPLELVSRACESVPGAIVAGVAHRRHAKVFDRLLRPPRQL